MEYPIVDIDTANRHKVISASRDAHLRRIWGFVRIGDVVVMVDGRKDRGNDTSVGVTRLLYSIAAEDLGYNRAIIVHGETEKPQNPPIKAPIDISAMKMANVKGS